MSLFTVDPEKCKRDGICVAACPLDVLEMTDKEATPSLKSGAEQRCVTCGHCVAVCPYGAIAHQNMAPEDCLPFRKELGLSLEQAEHFFMARRSIRVYEDKPVPRDTLNKLMRMTSYAPAAHNKQFTQWLIIEDISEIKRLAGLVVECLRFMLNEYPHMDPIMDMSVQIEAWGKGVDSIFRGAPTLIVAHANEALLTIPGMRQAVQSVFTISLSHLELAAASLGLGACWAGYFMAASESYPPINEALRLPEGNVNCGAIMIGYPQFQYQRIPLRNEPMIIWR